MTMKQAAPRRVFGLLAAVGLVAALSLPSTAAEKAALPVTAADKAAPPAAAAKATAATTLDQAGVDALIKEIDRRQNSGGDYKTQVYIETKERGKNSVVYEAVIYRRDSDDRFMILFTGPKAERGKGYLKIERNLWMYDPTVGRWDRRTERERIGGTDSRRTDFDESTLSTDYAAKYVERSKLGRFDVHVVELTARSGIDVAWPKVKLWIDVASSNILKRQDYAASGRLMRTTYTPKWKKVMSPSAKESVWVPGEIRIFDEVEKDNKTTVLMKQTDLNPLPKNIFSKAWLESKSR